MRITLILAAAGLVFSAHPAAANEPGHDPAMPDILSLRAQAAVRDAWLTQRLDTVVPMLMRREGIDLWLLIAREYNEDPVVTTLLPATWMAARRRTVLIFYDRGAVEGVENLSVSRYAVGERFQAAWSPQDQPDQWQRVAELIAERKPHKIALNRSALFALADGLSAAEEKTLITSIGPDYARRLVSAENLALGWLETRIPEEMTVYPTIVRIAHAIIAEGLSEEVITPGITRIEDVAWWYRERIRALGLDTWFHPGVSLQRAGTGAAQPAARPADDDSSLLILPGDLLHVDLGITYLGLNTDTQHHAYVLRPGETAAPAGLKAGMAAANQVQDILVRHFKTGLSGNQLLARARREAIEAGFDPTIYSHPLGFHGHGAGPSIGMWDDQLSDPPTGDYTIQPDTAWSVELNVIRAVPEWGGDRVRFMAEEDAYFDGETLRFLDGRQVELHLIPRQ